MSVESAPGEIAAWPSAAPPTWSGPLPSTAGPPGGRQRLLFPVAAAALGAAGLAVGAAGFFLSSRPVVITILASVALTGAIGGAGLGGWSVRRPLGELGVIGIVAGGLSLPLSLFELVVVVAGQLA